LLARFRRVVKTVITARSHPHLSIFNPFYLQNGDFQKVFRLQVYVCSFVFFPCTRKRSNTLLQYLVICPVLYVLCFSLFVFFFVLFVFFVFVGPTYTINLRFQKSPLCLVFLTYVWTGGLNAVKNISFRIKTIENLSTGP